MHDTLPWDPVRDFVAITSAVSSPNVPAVHAAVAEKSAGELIALARARPGQLNYSPHGSAGLFSYA